jgi:hypothetical protein
MGRHARSLFCFALVLCLSILPVSTFADESKKKSVLLLYYDNQGNISDLVESFDKGLRSAFGDRIGLQIELNVEYTDFSRNSSPAYLDQLAGLFKLKYGGTPPDLIIVNLDPYSDFLASLCYDLFPKAKIVFSLFDVAFLDALDRFPGRSTAVYIESGRDDSPDLIQRVLPETIPFSRNINGGFCSGRG